MATWTKSKEHDQITHHRLAGFDRWYIAVVTGNVYLAETVGDSFILMRTLKAAKARIEEKASA